MNQRTIELMVGSMLTRCQTDNEKAAFLWRSGDPAIRAAILAARKRWLEYEIDTQRRWQARTRRVTLRAVLHRWALWGERHTLKRIEETLLESVAVREKYVRVSR